MDTQTSFDKAKARAFTDKVLADTSGAMATIMAYIGDRLGLFKDLAAHSPATSAELAARTQTVERYAREWLAAMTCAGYVAYDPTTARYTLPPEHWAVLAHDTAIVSFSGAHQMLIGMLRPLDQLIAAFQHGGGVPQSAYGDDTWDGMARDTQVSIENFLVQQWLAALPNVTAKLERGALVADVGCGSGGALIKLAQTFPRSRYVGYDLFAPTIATATANAQAAGVADRVTFVQHDIAQGVAEPFDLVLTFDVIHDATEPLALLRAIRGIMRPDGIYLCREPAASDQLDENIGPLGALRYGYSVLYCMTTSLANGGEGLGTLGLTESKMRALCAEAGFGHVHRLALDDMTAAVYVVKP